MVRGAFIPRAGQMARGLQRKGALALHARRKVPMKALRPLVAVGFAFAVSGCIFAGDDDDDDVDNGDDCVTSCEDTHEQCIVDCDDDACVAVCDTDLDDCKTDCD